MSDSPRSWPVRRPPVREPIFNVAPAVVGLAAVLLAIHAIRVWVLSPDADGWVIEAFAFIPVREFAPSAELAGFPGGEAARVWTLVTYALLHGNWPHVLINTVWMLAFGNPLAQRFGTVRFLVFSAVGAIGGVLFHFAFFSGDATPLVGASAAISAHMAGVCRFVFEAGGPLSGLPGSRGRFDEPAPPLRRVLANPRVLGFIAIWFGVNLAFGLTGGAGLASGPVAWDAHIGGFLVGLLLFPLFDPRR